MVLLGLGLGCVALANLGLDCIALTTMVSATMVLVTVSIAILLRVALAAIAALRGVTVNMSSLSIGIRSLKGICGLADDAAANNDIVHGWIGILL